MVQKEKEQVVRDLVQVVTALSGELASLTDAINPILFLSQEDIREEIAAAKAMNVEELPPDIVRYWVAAKDVLAREGYTLTFNIMDWYANPAYQRVVVTPQREGDVFGKPPIVAAFIISKSTHKLATRVEITEALKSHYHPEPVDFENHQIHGLEVLVLKNVFDIPNKLGIETLLSLQSAVQELQPAVQGKRLLLRRNVAHDLGSYGSEVMGLYQPQTPDDVAEFKPPLSHTDYVLQQEKKEKDKLFEEWMRTYMIKQLVGILKQYAQRTQ